jgi:hypothetical protein
MRKSVFFDHIEVHVEDIPRYCDFLVKIFDGGRFKQISESGISMFTSNDGINIEIKKRDNYVFPSIAGFCCPCLRMENAKKVIEQELGLEIQSIVNNPDGNCYFFLDHEGITWHIKDYLIRDEFINW